MLNYITKLISFQAQRLTTAAASYPLFSVFYVTCVVSDTSIETKSLTVNFLICKRSDV